jgi:predicted esterase|eukprot:COSAG01_NODE_7164_length_3323_cov_4.681452_4_plen_67_part_00
MSLVSTLAYPKKLAGGVVLSGWAQMQDEWGTLIHAENKVTPIFWGHGAADPVVLAQCQTEGVRFTT